MSGWFGLAGYVVAYDVVQWIRGKPTMSVAWGRWLERKPTHALCALLWMILTHHLWASRMPAPLRKTWRFPERKVV